MKRENIFTYSLPIIICFLSCDKGNINSISTKEVQENFQAFFDIFKSDSLFQQQRIINPLLVETINDESDEYDISRVKTPHISFDQKDWKESLKIDVDTQDQDTVIVSLIGKDTGLLLDHYFVLEKGHWFLIKIRNSSD